VGQSKQTFRVDEAAIVEALYDAALEPDLLPAALHSFARSLNGSMGHALFLGTPSSIAASSGSQDIAASYAREWWKHDVATERGHTRRLHGLVTTAELTSPKERASLPYYQLFAREYDCFWGCARIFRQPGSPSMVVGVRRPEAFGDFDGAELRLLERLARHVARAMEIASKLKAAAAQTSILCEALTLLGYGVIGINAQGRALFVNQMVETIGKDGLVVSNGAVLASMCSRQRDLDALISETVALAEKSTPLPPRPVALPRPSGRAPIVVFGCPVAVRHWGIGSILSQSRVLLLVIEPDAVKTLDERLLQEMFDLSPGEARVASAVARGKSARQAAGMFNVTEGTLRIQLKRVFQKIGVSRQAELVLLLAPLLTRMPTVPTATERQSD
jgi:DNA-binding CsgD family transcriptional regulator